MKKITILILLITGVFIGCQKDDRFDLKSNGTKLSVEKTEDQFGLSNEGRFLVFNSVEGYANAVEDPDSETLEEFYGRIEELEHYSLHQYLIANSIKESLVDDDLFESILSDDYTVQIGRTIFKINPESGKVFALSVDNISAYRDLVEENVNNARVMQFSVEEEIISYLDENGDILDDLPDPMEFGCGESGAPSRSENVGGAVNIAPLRALEFPGRIRYAKFGIYYNLKAKFQSFVQGLTYDDLTTEAGEYYSSGSGLYLKIEGQRRYKKKCGSDTYYSLADPVIGYVNDEDDELEMKVYSGFKQLTKFHLMNNFYFYNFDTESWINIGTLTDRYPTSDIYPGNPSYMSGVKYGY